MSRLLVALLVALTVGVLATPVSAHVHGHDTAPATTPAVLPPIVTALSDASRSLAVLVASAAETCDRHCDHVPGAGGCSCMATCVAIALSEGPAFARPIATVGPRPGDAAPWRPTALVPPTPPPRIL